MDARLGIIVDEKDSILDNIERFLENTNLFNLNVTNRASYALISFQSKLKLKPEKYSLTSTNASDLQKIMVNIANTLYAESAGLMTYIVTEKRIDVSKLLNNIESLFPPNVFNSMTDIAKIDMNEAGKCIAFNRPTAAAFHLLRGTESMIRELYDKKVKRNKISSNLWSPIIVDLKNKKKISGDLFNSLDNIRLSYRNPTQHPEKVYDIEEVQNLFSLCVDATTKIIALF
jgi:hypothetical protein